MAGAHAIGNPLGAFGQEVTHNSVVMECVAGTGGTARGDVVALTWSTTTGRVTATKSATGDSRTLRFGVAEEATVAGEIVKVTVFGPTFVNGGGNAFAAGEGVFRSAATAAIADRAALAAADVPGAYFGTALGVKSATATSPYPFVNAVPVFVERL